MEQTIQRWTGREAIHILVAAGALRDAVRPECVREDSLPPISPDGRVTGIAFRSREGLICPDDVAVTGKSETEASVPPTMLDRPASSHPSPAILDCSEEADVDSITAGQIPSEQAIQFEAMEEPVKDMGATELEPSGADHNAAVVLVSQAFEEYLPPARLSALWKSYFTAYPDDEFERRYLADSEGEDPFVSYVVGYARRPENQKAEVIVRRCPAMEDAILREVVYLAANPYFGSLLGRGALEAVAAYFTAHLNDKALEDQDLGSAVEPVAQELVELLAGAVGQNQLKAAFFGQGVEPLARFREKLNAGCGPQAFGLLRDLTDHKFPDYDLALRVAQGNFPTKELAEDIKSSTAERRKARLGGPIQTQVQKAVRVVMRFTAEALFTGLPERQTAWARSAFERVILPQRLGRAEEDTEMVRRFRSMVSSQVIRDGLGALPADRRWQAMVGQYYEARLAPLSVTAFDAARAYRRGGGDLDRVRQGAADVLTGLVRIIEGMEKQKPVVPAVVTRALSDSLLDCRYATGDSSLMSLRLNRHLDDLERQVEEFGP